MELLSEQQNIRFQNFCCFVSKYLGGTIIIGVSHLPHGVGLLSQQISTFSLKRKRSSTGNVGGSLLQLRCAQVQDPFVLHGSSVLNSFFCTVLLIFSFGNRGVTSVTGEGRNNE